MINSKSLTIPTMLVRYKKRGQTPLDVVEDIKKNRSELTNIKLGYAGRLDPMAEGVMIILVGDENKKKEEYQNLEKEYEVHVVFGIETDSQDLLGMIESIGENVEVSNIHASIEKYVGQVSFPLPLFSGATKNGKKLFALARSKQLEQSETAVKSTAIHSIQIIEEGRIALCELAGSALSIIPTIRGDFRQEEILEQWEMYKGDARQLAFCKLRVIASSGTYMRSLARALGQDMETGAIATHIVRARVGPYTKKDEKQS